MTELTTDSAPIQRKKQWLVLSLFWISLELQTENLLLTNERAQDSSSARIACLVAKDLLEVVLAINRAKGVIFMIAKCLDE